MLLIVIIINIFSSKNFEKFYFASLIFFTIILPSYGLGLAIIHGGISGDFIDTSYLISGLFFFLSLAFLGKNESFAVEGLIFSLRCLSIAILSLFLLTGAEIFSDIANFYIVNGIAFIGTREYSGYTFPYLYFVASPMLIFFIAYQTWDVLKKRTLIGYIWLILAVLSMFLTGTRAAMIMAISGVIFIYGWFTYGRKSLLLYPSLLLLFLIFAMMLPFSRGIIDAFFDVKEGSNATKLAYLDSYLNIFNEPLYFFTGQGFNAHTWSFEFAKNLSEGASKVELTYLEFIRVFGIVMFIPFMFILYCVTLGSLSKKTIFQWYPGATFLYLLISATNPYIFSMNGMLILGLACVLTIQKSRAYSI
ncbi:O-antigen ligase family protein [Aeromonas allosaccharophila]